MAQVWSIIINGEVPAKFDADVFGTDPGKPLKAQAGDLVSWNNQTTASHKIKVGTFETTEIASYKSSTPGYVVDKGAAGPDGTITYTCTIPGHSAESGQIQVVAS